MLPPESMSWVPIRYRKNGATRAIRERFTAASSKLVFFKPCSAKAFGMWITKNGIAVRRSNQQAAPGHESALHEATPCGLFPQVDDQQAEDEGRKR